MTEWKDIETLNIIAYEGYRGDMVINKLWTREGMFGFVEPIVNKDISVYALYNRKHDQFFGYGTSSKICGHLYGKITEMPIKGLCIGTLHIDNHMEIKLARETCKVVNSQMSVVNTLSLGSYLGILGGKYENINNILRAIKECNEPINRISNFDKYFKRLL
jgi:hypothetical protein